MSFQFTDQRTLVLSPDFEEKLEFFRKERVVVFKTQAEKGVGLDERAATGDNFGAASRDPSRESRTPEKRERGLKH
jgi:hypothetical protein